ncbi:hypothetical protein [Oceanicola sp. S124]|uniref:hypothetical protein n=1 Tax=Oceanicola sp. S124 TaxID=1042378 RepID=UPI000255852E|nr:hypothetical protein [Oceanicola sp. S124]
MPRLILHIGTHKTGTTAIQGWLAAQTAALAGAGWHYGATDRPPHPDIPKHTSLYRALAEGRFAAERRAILADHTASGLPGLILSEEGLSLPCYHAFAPLRDLAQDYQITVVGLFRRQDRLMESHWNQLCKQGQTGLSLEDFCRREWHRKRREYDRILDFWDGFARVEARAYDPAVEGGAVAQFLEAAGLPFAAGPKRLANLSPSMNAAALSALLTRHGLRRLVPLVTWSFRADTRPHGLGRALRTEILAEVAAGNARLADRYGLHFDDRLPDEPETPLAVPDMSALARALVRRIVA